MYVKSIYTPRNREEISLGYIVTAPTGFDKSERLPLIVFLHGAGERGENIETVKVHGIPKYFSADPDYKGLRVVTLSPQCPNGMVWNNIVFEVKALIDAVAAEYNCDADRVTVTGLSMGGFGTWELAMTFPDAFAGIAPICGGGMSWRAGALSGMPIRAFHGEDDTTVPPSYTREMIRVIEACGGKPEATYYPGVGHGSWENAYGQSDLIEWLASLRRGQ